MPAAGRRYDGRLCAGSAATSDQLVLRRQQTDRLSASGATSAASLSMPMDLIASLLPADAADARSERLFTIPGHHGGPAGYGIDAVCC